MSSGVMFSGGAAWTSFVWLGGGWVDGACCGTSFEVLEVGLVDGEPPIPGVIGPRLLKEEGACGAGASGTACCSAGVCWGCVWANTAGLRLNDELSIAVSASALRPRSTGILSSRYDTAPAGFWPAGASLLSETDKRDRTR